MNKVSVMVLMCLFAGKSGSQAGHDGNNTQMTELSDGNLENTKVETFEQEPPAAAVWTSNLTRVHTTCESNICMVMKELGALEERQKATVRALEETNRKLEASEKQLAALNNTLTEMTRVYEGQPHVAFSAAMSTDTTIGPLNVLYPLVYGHVHTNIGGHYSPVTGYFTAPVRGVYYFSYSSFWWAGDGTSGGSLYHNSYRVASWYGYSRSHPISGSNSAVLLLEVGDVVNVRLWSPKRISDNGNKYSTFSGFLLFPL